MIRTYSLFFLLVLTRGLYAQDWEMIGGPGDELIRGLTIAPNGAMYVISNGIYRSTDKGASWRRSGLELPVSGSEPPVLRCDKNNVLYYSEEKGLWRSVDEGLSWNKIKSGNSSPPSVAVTPQGIITTLDRDSVSISNNGGSSWRDVHVADDLRGLYVDSIGTIFAAGRFTSYRSTDQGENWSKLINGFPAGDDVYDMQFSSDGKTLAATDDYGIIISTDRGLTWSTSGDDYYIVRFTIADNNVLFGMGSSGEVLRSSNLGGTWTELSGYVSSIDRRNANMAFHDGSVYYYFKNELLSRTVSDNALSTVSLPNAYVKDFIVGPSATLFAVTRTSNTWSLVNNSWNKLAGFAGASAIAIDSTNILYGIGGTKFYRSSDGGKTVTSSTGIGTSVTSLAVGKEGEVLAATPGEGFYRSTDGGTIWMQSNAGMPDKVLSSVAIGAGDVFFAGGNMRYYRSTDEGLTWTEPIFPFISGSGTVRTIATSGERVVFGIDLTGVYFSSDNGVTWENHSTGLALDTIYDIAITSQGAVVSATSSGVYLYSAALQTWREIGPGVVQRSTRTIAEGKDGRLYIGTDGYGVYRTTQVFSDVASEAGVSSTASIYPNPASTEIYIYYKSDKPEKYKTTIYNLLGEPLLTAMNQDVVNVSSLAAGQYFVRIVSNDKTSTLPLVIVR